MLASVADCEAPRSCELSGFFRNIHQGDAPQFHREWSWCTILRYRTSMLRPSSTTEFVPILACAVLGAEVSIFRVPAFVQSTQGPLNPLIIAMMLQGPALSSVMW